MNRKERAMSKTAIRTEGLTKIYKGDLGRKPVVGIEVSNSRREPKASTTMRAPRRICAMGCGISSP